MTTSFRERGRRPAARRNDGERAADFVRELIVRGELRREDRVIAEDVATELGMSRIPVREGLIALEREGWVAVEPRRGTFVRGLDRGTVRDHHELVGLIHGLAARRAVERGVPVESGSKRAQVLLRVLPPMVSADLSDDIGAAQERATAAIARAVAKGDADAADLAARVGFRRIGERVGAVLAAQGVLSPEEDVRTRSRWRRQPTDPDDNGADRASRHVRERILHGELVADQRLDRNEIGGLVGVSRTPMREAMIALEREGWITIEPHRGAFVNAFDASTAADHYDLFARLFAFATRRMVEHEAPDELLARNAVLQGIDDPDEFERVNGELLDLLVAGARSNPLVAVLRAMPEIVPGNFFAEVPGGLEAQRRGVGRVCKSLAVGDLDRADDAWAAMMRAQARCVLALF